MHFSRPIRRLSENVLSDRLQKLNAKLNYKASQRVLIKNKKYQGFQYKFLFFPIHFAESEVSLLVYVTHVAKTEIGIFHNLRPQFFFNFRLPK